MVDINKTMHKAGVNKIRCPACKAGMAVEVQNAQGKKIMRCERCSRQFAAEQRL